VDFAVERDRGIPVVAHDRLVSAGKVDDLQTHRAQGRDAALEHAVLVGPAMVKYFRDPVGYPPAHVSTKACKPRNPTHLALHPETFPFFDGLMSNIAHLVPKTLELPHRPSRSSVPRFHTICPEIHIN